MANIEKRVKGKTFGEWKFVVAYHVVKLCGMEPDDIPDWDYYGAWSAEVTPVKAATAALEAAGLY